MKLLRNETRDGAIIRVFLLLLVCLESVKGYCILRVRRQHPDGSYHSGPTNWPRCTTSDHLSTLHCITVPSQGATVGENYNGIELILLPVITLTKKVPPRLAFGYCCLSYAVTVTEIPNTVSNCLCLQSAKTTRTI